MFHLMTDDLTFSKHETQAEADAGLDEAINRVNEEIKSIEATIFNANNALESAKEMANSFTIKEVPNG